MLAEQVFEDIKGRIESPDAGFLPLYHKVQLALRDAIENGEIVAGAGLPAERNLADRLGVSRVTIRAALRGLVEEGFLEARQGAGTFVRPRFDMPLNALTGFSEDMRVRGVVASSRVLDAHSGAATPRERHMLNLVDGAEVTRIYRLRVAQEKPLSIELAVLPRTAIAADVEFGESLYAYLGSISLRPVRAVQRLRAELLEFEQARILEVMPGTAGFYIERQSYLENDEPIEYVQSHFRGDAYDFVVELKL